MSCAGGNIFLQLQGNGHHRTWCRDMAVGASQLQAATPVFSAGCWVKGADGKGQQVFQSHDCKPILKQQRTILVLFQLQTLGNCSFF